MAKSQLTVTDLTVQHWEALRLARFWEMSDGSQGYDKLFNGMGVHKRTVLVLQHLGLMTVESGYDREWAEGMQEDPPLKPYWVAVCTPDGIRRFDERWALLKHKLTDATEWSVDYTEVDGKPGRFHLLVHNGTPRSGKNAHPKYNGQEFASLEIARWFALNAGLVKVDENQPVVEEPAPAPASGQPVYHERTGVLVGHLYPDKFVPVD